MSGKNLFLQEFVSGLLVANEIGATYKGEVYDRFLKVRVNTGHTLPIFDDSWPAKPISTNMSIGHSYRLILVSSVNEHLAHFSSLYSVGAHEWEGAVLSSTWQLPHDPGQIFSHYVPRQNELRRNWVLLSTPYGGVLMAPEEIEDATGRSVQVGDQLRWVCSRLDLLAVI